MNELSLDATKYVTFISHNQSNVADNRIFLCISDISNNSLFQK